MNRFSHAPKHIPHHVNSPNTAPGAFHFFHALL
ncbi:unnamed protein product, partial [Callosobruchus maculatus]